MNTKEYLMEEFGIDEQKAEEVASKMKELAHQHKGHKSHNEENEEKEDVKEMIMETQAEIEAFRKAASSIHCSGCEKHCCILSPGCGRGRKVGQMLLSQE